MAWRFATRSTTPGDYALRPEAIAVLEAARNTDPGVANVWNAISYKIQNVSLTGTKRASSITNCSAANIKDDVVIDDVTGTFEGSGGTLPAINDTELESGLYTILTSETYNVVDYCSNRVYPLAAPQKVTCPYIVYARTSTSRETYLGGTLGLVNADLDITVWDDCYKDAKLVSAYVKQSLLNWGSVSDVVVGSVLTNETEEVDDTDIDGKQGKLFGITLTYSVTYNETAAG